ncbi:putative undecaprenyl-phosphate N-acetylglucosaminyl 1-phosphate transferase [Anaerohalosphaera lusitana]|uniref:Putative undecaprenyl-phosphate N-acetylglucosaminyl 1-phosphate transferase n=1 Tax=Anaerohalosphaera lusitana TaxID=1936003 RepID=A0A1U9NIA3_9BACT|nr:MraY family glycosyltransferase [Anaerohalosphaera lusitana]AQT67659.1 putative undecaprenyl-phosphate N-acetylglucosaminyl 1-phosphate transferase [Anaerohalosphaera lusitana]
MATVIVGIVVGVCGFLVSAGGTVLVRRGAVRRDFVARPVADRYHRTIIPLGGGIAIFWTMALLLGGGLAVTAWAEVLGLEKILGEGLMVHREGFLDTAGVLGVVLGCAAVLHVMGLVDDVKGLGWGVKLGVQFAAAFAAAYFGDVRVELFIESRVVTAGLSAFWIVLIINAFNFLDNMDGLSAGIAFIATGVLLVAAVYSEQFFVGALAIAFMGALGGFLWHNFPPAKIFMGDAGSLVVGFFVATLTLKTTYYHEETGGGLYAVFMPLVVMAVPLYDFISVTVLRISQGKSPFVGDTQHFSHRLKRRGLSDVQTAGTLYLATLCTGIGAIFLWQVDIAGAVLIFAQTVMILAIIAIMEATGKGNAEG